MKKFKILLITLFIFLLGISNVSAMSLKPTGSSSGKRGNEITIYVTLNRDSSEKMVSAIDGKLTFDSGVFTLVRAESLMSGWTEFSGISNNGTFSYANLTFDKLITDTNKNVAKVVLKINSDAAYGNTTISVSGASATDENGDGVSISSLDHTFRVLSDVNTLTNITVDGDSIGFDENKASYDIELNTDVVEISAVKKDSSSSVSGDVGNKTLKYGKNVFKIAVTSESGVKKEYVLNITRPDNRNKVNTLDSLNVSEGKISFKKETVKYDITLENKITSIKVDATLTDEKSSFVSGYEPRTVELKEGKNVIEIKVKAENETVKIYTINVTRKSNKSNNNYLSELKLSEGTLVFDKETFEYKVVVLYEVEKIEVEAKTEHNKATYEVDMPKNLVVGENTITIKVKAEDGSIKEYKVVVIRKEEDVELSNNNKLANLTIDGYDIKFSGNVYDYDLLIGDEKSLIINYILEDDKSSGTVEGNNELENGSVIRVKVTAEDGSVATYKINIQKEESNGLLILLIIGSILLLLIIIVVVIVSNNKKKKKPIDNNTNNNINDREDLAIKQDIQYQQNVPRIQTIQNMTYTQSPQNMQSDQAIQNNSNDVNVQGNNNFFQ